MNVLAHRSNAIPTSMAKVGDFSVARAPPGSLFTLNRRRRGWNCFGSPSKDSPPSGFLGRSHSSICRFVGVRSAARRSASMIQGSFSR